MQGAGEDKKWGNATLTETPRDHGREQKGKKQTITPRQWGPAKEGHSPESMTGQWEL